MLFKKIKSIVIYIYTNKMNTNSTKKIFVHVPYEDKEHAKRKGARFDKYSKCWYFNIEVGESLNKSCRGYPIKKIEIPVPTFEEAFNISHPNNDDPFSDNESDTFAHIDRKQHISQIIHKVDTKPKKIYLYDAFNIDIDNFNDTVAMFLKCFYITYDGNKWLLHYCLLVQNSKFYHTTQMEPNLDRAKVSGLQAINNVLHLLCNIPDETLNELSIVRRNVLDSIARNYLAIGKTYEPEDSHCGYDKMLVFSFDELKAGIAKFIDKCFD
jgi:hypothetical protein